MSIIFINQVPGKWNGMLSGHMSPDAARNRPMTGALVSYKKL
jgi:hypothetical protein